MEQQTFNMPPFKRTGERVLGIIGIVFNVLGIVMVLGMNALVNMMTSDPAFQQEFEAEILRDPTIPADEAQYVIDLTYGIFNTMAGFGWFLVVAFIISIILTIVALVKLKKNAKLSGILFLIAGFLAGILSLTSIILYIAGIMCLVRKPRAQDAVGDTGMDNEPMRPL